MIQRKGIYAYVSEWLKKQRFPSFRICYYILYDYEIFYDIKLLLNLYVKPFFCYKNNKIIYSLKYNITQALGTIFFICP